MYVQTEGAGRYSWPSPDAQCLCDSTQELTLEDKLAFLVLLAGLVSLIVFPANRLVTLFADYVSYNMPPRRHITLHGFGLLDVHYAREEEGFAVLAAKVARYDIVEVCKMRLALLVHPSSVLDAQIRVVTVVVLLPCSQRSCLRSNTRYT